MSADMIEVKLRVPRRIDDWFRGRGYDEQDYEGMLWGGLAAEMDLRDAEGTRELRRLLEDLRRDRSTD